MQKILKMAKNFYITAMKFIAYFILLSAILLPLQSCDYLNFKDIKANEYNNMGAAHAEKQEYDKAMECYEKAIKIKPDKAETYFLIGVIHHEKQEYDLAVEYYKKAIELKPDLAYLASAYNNIGTIYREKKEYDLAMEYYKKAIELEPDEPTILSNIQQTIYNIDKEKKEREQAQQNTTQDTTTHSNTPRSKPDVMEVVNANMHILKKIYNDYLKKKPGFTGKVTLKFIIAAKGEITYINIVSSTTGYPEFDEAVKNAVAKWKWKAIESGNVTPTIPFNFSE